MLEWFVNQVWPNIFASGCTLVIGYVFGRRKFRKHMSELHDKIDKLL